MEGGRENLEEEFDYVGYRQAFTKEAREILRELTLEEKIYLMSGLRSMEEVRRSIQKKVNAHYNESPYRAGGLEDHEIPALYFADGTKGVVCGRDSYTCFPVTSMRGASFDRDLEREVGEAIGWEVIHAGGNLFGGVCVNLPYHPGWGRTQESYGEDSYLLGEMGSSLVKGVQSTGVIACVKHFAFNSMENARFEVNITCDKRTEQEVFLPHFRKCIEAGAGAVMSAYNSYAGEMCGQNSYLLTETLRTRWKFDGITMCDFNWGIKDTVTAANAGMNLEMPNTHYYGETLLKAVKKEQVSESQIDTMVLQIIRTLLAHEKLVEDYKKEAGIGQEKKEATKKDSVKASLNAHHDLARRCAVAGLTLLKNENQLLPLSPGKCKKIVVIGKLANGDICGDHGSSQVYPPYEISILQGILRELPGHEVIYYDGASLGHCKRLAKEADALILVVGNEVGREGEYVYADMEDVYVKSLGGDRIESLGLTAKDQELADCLTKLRSDVILLMIGGSAITMGDYEKHAGAILFSYYPGMEGGSAIARVLFGKECPGGKLPFFIPKREEDLPAIDFHSKEQFYGYYVGYRYLEAEGKKPLYPFGYGLTYTSFSWEVEEKFYSKNGFGEEEKAFSVRVRVTNTGNCTGSEVMQLYVSYEQEPKKLCDFSKLTLKKGESKLVTLTCKKTEIEFFDEESGEFKVRPGKYCLYLGNSSEAGLCEEIIR